MLTVALAKGRLLKSFIKYLNEIRETEIAYALEQRERQLLITVNDIQFILFNCYFVPIFVVECFAVIVIVGSYILEEGNYFINNLLYFPFGECHFSLAAKPEAYQFKKVATSYTQSARQYFEAQGLD